MSAQQYLSASNLYLNASGLEQVLKYIISANSYTKQSKAWGADDYLRHTMALVDALFEKRLVSQPVCIDYTYSASGSIINIDKYIGASNIVDSRLSIPQFLLYALQSNDMIGIAPMSVYLLDWVKPKFGGIFNYIQPMSVSKEACFAGVAFAHTGARVKEQPLFYLLPSSANGYYSRVRPYFPYITETVGDSTPKILGYKKFYPDSSDNSIFDLLSPSDVFSVSVNEEDLTNDGVIKFANRSNYVILRKNPISTSTTEYIFVNNAAKLKKTTTMIITYKTTSVEYVGTYSTDVSYEHNKAVVAALLADSVIASDWEADTTGTILIAKNSSVEDFNIAFKSALDTISPFTWQKSTTSVTKNYLSQSDVTIKNAIYEIRYDFDLNDQTITLPDNCVLYFKGGTINNGTLTLNDAYIDYKDKAFNNVTFSGNYKSEDNKLGYGAYLKLKDGSLIKSDSKFKDSYSADEVIGIVCRTKNINLLIPATTLKTSVYFCNGSSSCPDVNTISTATIASTYYNGYATTNLLRKGLIGDTNWAANLAYQTILDGRHCWLPSMGELSDIVSLKDEITTILTKLGITWNFNEIWSCAIATLKDNTDYINYVYGYYWSTKSWDGFNCQGAYTVLPVTTAEGSDYNSMLDYVTQSDILGIIKTNIN